MQEISSSEIVFVKQKIKGTEVNNECHTTIELLSYRNPVNNVKTITVASLFLLQAQAQYSTLLHTCDEIQKYSQTALSQLPNG